MKEIEQKRGQMGGLEYLARMRRFTIHNNTHSIMDVIKSFSAFERITGYKNKHVFNLASTSKLLS